MTGLSLVFEVSVIGDFVVFFMGACVRVVCFILQWYYGREIIVIIHYHYFYYYGHKSYHCVFQCKLSQ